MPEIKVRIINANQIQSAFYKAPRLMTKNLNVAIQKTVLTIDRKSKMNTPVDTGRLRASHYTQFSNLSGTIGTKTPYDVYVHEGTRFMGARPYLRNAVEKSTDDVDKFFTEAVDKTLNEIARSI